MEYQPPNPESCNLKTWYFLTIRRYSERLLEVVSRKMNESMSFEGASRNTSRIGKEETL